MTARVVLSCDGREGIYDCRQAIPVGAVLNGAHARHLAGRDGWSAQLTGTAVADFCPACTRRRAQERRR